MNAQEPLPAVWHDMNAQANFFSVWHDMNAHLLVFLCGSQSSGLSSVATLLLTRKEASEVEFVLDKVRQADAIFFAGTIIGIIIIIIVIIVEINVHVIHIIIIVMVIIITIR
jgi:hypothetical protein